MYNINILRFAVDTNIYIVYLIVDAYMRIRGIYCIRNIVPNKDNMLDY